MTDLTLAFNYARREMRGGIKGFRVFLICLVLGVAAISAVGSMNESFQAGLQRDARGLLGGDLSLTLSSRATTDQEQAYLQSIGTVSKAMELRAMAAGPDRRQIVELKAVDGFYPLAGALETAENITVTEGLAGNGALVEQSLLNRLGAEVGDELTIGNTTIIVRGTITREPDRITSFVNFGPRLMVSTETLEQSGLVLPGSIIRYFYRVALTNPDFRAEAAALQTAFPEAGWRIDTPDQAAPQVEQFVERLSLFMSFVGFTTLLIGGIGIATSVKDYLSGKTGNIATYKCLGAPSRMITMTYLMQVGLLASAGIVGGLAIGVGLPMLAVVFFGDLFPVRPEISLYPLALIQAASFGFLVTAAFTLWPLGQAQRVRAASLFRDRIAPLADAPPLPHRIGAIGCGVALAALTILTAYSPNFALFFVIGALAALGVLNIAGRLLTYTAARLPHPKSASLRLGLAALHRPGAVTRDVVLSLGLGLTVLVAIALIEANLRSQVQDRLPGAVPAFFFIDIQNTQAEGFEQAVTGVEGIGEYASAPSLRGRIVAIKGVPVEDVVLVDPGEGWALEGDRGLTFSPTVPEGAEIVQGTWWDADYSGPPLMSMEDEMARGFGMEIGDTITFNVLGREITAELAATRVINWRSLRMNFTFIFSPGVLNNAPHTYISTLYAPREVEDPVERAIADDFPNVSVVRVRDALEAAQSIMAGISAAIAGTASIALIAGTVVLMGAVASGRERRGEEAVVLKVLGATRRRILTAYLAEYGLLGVTTGIIAGAVGTTTAWAVTTQLMGADWIFHPDILVMTVGFCLTLTILFGFAGTWRSLTRKAGPVLRNE